MQVTVTVDVPEKHFLRVPTFRARIRPGVVALSKRSTVDALPATQPTPALNDPHDTPDFWQSVCDLLERGDPDATLPDPVPVAQPSPKTRKVSYDLDAALLKAWQDYDLRLWASLASGRQFKRDQERDIATENAQRAKKHLAPITIDDERADELDGQIAGYEAMHEAVKAIIAALETSYDAYLDVLVMQVEHLETSISNKSDTYSSMRDSIIAAEVAEITRRWMGE